MANDELAKFKKSKTAIVFKYWKTKSIGEKVIFLSIVLSLSSLLCNWSVIHVESLSHSRGSKASLENIIFLFVIWSYPIFKMIKNIPITFYKGIIVSLLSLLWISINIKNSIYINSVLNGQNSKDFVVSIGAGVYVVVIASIMLLLGLVITRQNKSKQVTI